MFSELLDETEGREIGAVTDSTFVSILELLKLDLPGIAFCPFD